MITGQETVKELLDAHPALRGIIAGAGLDLCCGGMHPLAMAAQAHGVPLEPLLKELNDALARGA